MHRLIVSDAKVVHHSTEAAALDTLGQSGAVGANAYILTAERPKRGLDVGRDAWNKGATQYIFHRCHIQQPV